MHTEPLRHSRQNNHVHEMYFWGESRFEPLKQQSTSQWLQGRRFKACTRAFLELLVKCTLVTNQNDAFSVQTNVPMSLVRSSAPLAFCLSGNEHRLLYIG